MPFDDEAFDCVSAFETVYFWEDLEKCFAEVHRVMKNGGTFLICNESDGTNFNRPGYPVEATFLPQNVRTVLI